jgi:uncharacterized protein (DUF305 family)
VKHPRIALAFAALLALLVVMPAWAAPSEDRPASNQNVATVEQHFLMGMIPHHRGAIMMSEMAMVKATRPELREAAKKIVEDQNREKDLMAGYLQQWYGMEPPFGMDMPRSEMEEMMPMMHGTMPDTMARMRALEQKSGADFDIEYMSAIIDHHAMALMMTGNMLVSAEHPQLYPLGWQIVIAQGEEIKQFNLWLKSWYNVDRPV